MKRFQRIRQPPREFFLRRTARPILAILALLPAGCARPGLSIDDVIADTEGNVIVTADLKEDLWGLPKDVEHRPIRFFAGEMELATVTGDADGVAVLRSTLPDGDVPHLEARAEVHGTEVTGRGRVFRWDKSRVSVVVDIDGTISRTDFEELVFDEKDDDSRPMRDSVETLRQIAEEFQLVYLTARPSILLEKTRQWLALRGFPDGPVLGSHYKRDLLDHAAYKARVLRGLREDWPEMLIGIGDQISDAEAYGRCGMLTLIIFSPEKGELGRHVLAMPNWQVLGKFFRDNRQALSNPTQLRWAIAGKQPLLLTLQPYATIEQE